MGVKGLESFIENNIPQACQPTNIGHVARTVTNRSKVLIVDLPNLAYRIKARSPLDDFFGGDFIAYKKTWRDFMAKMEKIGVKVIFVCDGCKPVDHRPTWVRRRYDLMEDFVFATFDALKRGRFPNDEFFFNKSILPNYMVNPMLR